MALVKGTLSLDLFGRCFVYKVLNRKSFLFATLMVWDLQRRGFKLKRLKICLLKLFAVRSIKEGCVEPLKPFALSAVSPENTVIRRSRAPRVSGSPTC